MTGRNSAGSFCSFFLSLSMFLGGTLLKFGFWFSPPPPPPPFAGYDVNTLPPAIVGVLVSGSPRKYDHRFLPVLASRAKMVHDSVLKTMMSSPHTAEVGPSSSRFIPHSNFPLTASKQ